MAPGCWPLLFLRLHTQWPGQLMTPAATCKPATLRSKHRAAEDPSGLSGWQNLSCPFAFFLPSLDHIHPSPRTCLGALGCGSSTLLEFKVVPGCSTSYLGDYYGFCNHWPAGCSGQSRSVFRVDVVMARVLVWDLWKQMMRQACLVGDLFFV